MTKRLYYDDCYLTRFRARVVDASEDRKRVYLDETAFYPTSGGQPFDLGTIDGIAVIGVEDEDGRIAHTLEKPVGPADVVEGSVDWTRRFDHMQQHTGQHLLSAVLVELYGIATVSFHLGTEASTIDVATPSLTIEQVQTLEQKVNERVFANVPVTIGYQSADEVSDLRKPSEREGILRIVSIHELDRSACGGTHVRSTGEIGPLLIRKLDKIRGNVRIEFLCGMRAVRQARRDYTNLNRVAQFFSLPLDEAPSAVETQIAKLSDSEKQRSRLLLENAQFRGAKLYAETPADEDGIRRHHTERKDALGEVVRVEAQSFTANPKTIYIARAGQALLLAASADSGVHAGNVLKAAVTAAGGRGGGSAQMAQGSVPRPEEAARIAAELFAVAQRGD